MTPDALTPHFFTEFDKEARSRESIDPFYHDAVRLVEEYRAALNTITQQAQELERVKERLHRYNHWTPEHTIEEWLADRQRIVDAKQVEADAQLQATLAARELTWTTARPTVAGSYWHREKNGYVHIVDVDWCGGQLETMQDHFDHAVKDLQGDWCHIPIPTEAQQARGSSGGAANQGAGT